MRLNAGSLKLVTIGSVYGVYPAAIQRSDNQAARLGEIKITEVAGDESLAAIQSESQPGAIEIGCRAFAEYYNFGDWRLAVGVGDNPDYGAQLQEMTAKIQR